jgi:hypothetical protein
VAGDITLPVIFVLAGSGCAIAAVTGGGFKALVDFPSLKGSSRILIGILAFGFIGLAIFSYWHVPGGGPRAAVPTPPPPTGAPPGPSVTPTSPPTSVAVSSPTPVAAAEFNGVLVIGYIDNTGYLDIDGHKVWGGDKDEPSDAVDIGVDPAKVRAQGVARIALSEAGAKQLALQPSSAKHRQRSAWGKFRTTKASARSPVVAGSHTSGT